MKVTVLGAGNSGLAMAAHLSSQGNDVTLWNRTKETIEKLIKTHTIKCEGIIQGDISVNLVTDNLEQAILNTDIILITTPANSHKYLAIEISKYIKKDTLIVLNPGRTFGALEFLDSFREHNKNINITVAESQTIIYTCRKTGIDSVNIISLKSGVLISGLDSSKNNEIISMLPKCIRSYFLPAKSILETSIGNVGMILHCAPLLLNAGCTESEQISYKYYYNGITKSVGILLEELDKERLAVSERLGMKVESTCDWLIRMYNVKGNSIYECIQNNKAYKSIDAPTTLHHRYLLEDIPCGLVPLEAIGKANGISMKYTTMIIDLASLILNIDFRKTGRNINNLLNVKYEIEKYIVNANN